MIYLTPHDDALIHEGLLRGDRAVELTIIRDCDHCGGRRTVKQTAYFSTGIALEHYQPERGEILSNRWFECAACGDMQAS